jgi:hypothetical protein
MTRFLRIALLILVAASAPALAEDTGTSSMEILKEKIRADKKLLVDANMDLSDAEAKGFWPLYDGYQKELQGINRRLVTLVSDYADAYNKGPVPDDAARKFAQELLSIDEAELKLKRDYLPKLEKVLPVAKAVRYLQIENKIRALIRYEMADGIPLVD